MKRFEVKITEESAGIPSRFPWTTKNIDIMLDLYESKIDSFLSKHTKQAQIWRQLFEEMQQRIPQHKDQLSVQKIVSKFSVLKKKFKVEFFSLAKDISAFPHYEKMNKMFTDVAMRKLNETNPLNETTDDEIQLMVSQVLDKIDDTPEDHHYISTAQSKGELLKKRISELPNESVCIQQVKKMRIDPNTPFNRNVSQKALMNQRNSFLNSFQASQGGLSKRRLENESEFKPKIDKKVNSTDIYDDSQNNYIIEALDECELSNISMRHSKLIYQDQSSQGIRRGTTLNTYKRATKSVESYNGKSFKEPTKTIDQSSRGSMVKNASQMSNSVVSVDTSSNQTMKNYSVDEIKDTSDYSIAQVPQLPSFNSSLEYEYEYGSDKSFAPDVLRGQENDSAGEFYINETAKVSKPFVIPKKLSLLKEVQNFSTSTNDILSKLKNNPQISIKPKENSAPPAWFKNFLAKYEHDMKSINEKLNTLISK